MSIYEPPLIRNANFESCGQALLRMNWAVERLQSTPVVVPKPSVETSVQMVTWALQLAKLKATGRLQRIGPNKGEYWQVLE
jgi:plasmid replication initiation protein